jgi:hypothetical protein
MYGKSSWGGDVVPYIQAVFERYEGEADPIVSLIIFEWRDEDYIGKLPTPDATKVNRAWRWLSVSNPC